MQKTDIAMIILVVLGLVACAPTPEYDVVIRNGTIYDGSGEPGYVGHVYIKGDTIVSVGHEDLGRGTIEIDAAGLAVAPGFINVLIWATETLIEDGKSQSDIRQGVTLEVFGEGWSMGPLNDSMKVLMKKQQGDIKFEIAWTSLGEYLEYLERRGISTNVASFLGATTVRIHTLGYEDRAPTAVELDQMRTLVRHGMEEGALGIGSSLIYAPAFYAKTDELVELCKVAAEYGGMYISHMRSEGNQLLEAVDELLSVARRANIRSEIYHLKAAGQKNWTKIDQDIAGATGLDAAMPPWVQEGGHDVWVKRLKDPGVRKQVMKEMSTPSTSWENLYLAAGTAENVLLVGFKRDSLKYLTGKKLAEVARMRGKTPEETAIDLVINDDSRVGTVYFLMSEENVRRQIALPWISFGSDAESLAPEGVFLKSNPHPRAYGTFARVLGKYVREEKVIPLEEAVRRFTTLPAANLRLRNRGSLTAGKMADVVVFDPEKVRDFATFHEPHQYSTGVIHVFVNGVPVLKNGEHTGATPGRVVRGPGWRGAM